MVDDEDFERLKVYEWFITSTGYAKSSYFLMHREIMGVVDKHWKVAQ